MQQSRPTLWRRIAPALGLFVLAPLVAEYLLGDFPLTGLPFLVLLAPVYGGAALLIREVTRRAGRGWPTMLLLALAFGLLAEGVMNQSNPVVPASPGLALASHVVLALGALALLAVEFRVLPKRRG